MSLLNRRVRVLEEQCRARDLRLRALQGLESQPAVNGSTSAGDETGGGEPSAPLSTRSGPDVPPWFRGSPAGDRLRGRSGPSTPNGSHKDAPDGSDAVGGAAALSGTLARLHNMKLQDEVRVCGVWFVMDAQDGTDVIPAGRV